MKLQGVIFDLDGVITDTAHLHFKAWQQIAADARQPLGDAVYAHWAGSLE